MPAVLAVRASRSSGLLEVLDFLKEVRRPISVVEVRLSTLGGRSRQRRTWLVGNRDIRGLASEVTVYIEEHTKLWGLVDAIVTAVGPSS
ncbi:MAG TPA: hypothetical protein VMD75_13265 [Candidatus Binataceae bacterium]|jgi:hypothetical protein|nr:hypothetical protein [Candidatus Binataceae bacterium]